MFVDHHDEMRFERELEVLLVVEGGGGPLGESS